MSQEIKSLKYKRGAIKAGTTRLKNYFDSIQDGERTPEIMQQLSDRLNETSDYLSKFSELQEQIDLLCLEEDGADFDKICEASSKDKEVFEKNYFDIISKIKIFIGSDQEDDDQQTNSRNSDTNNFSSNAKLPEINLPVFSGKYEDWFEFYDTFLSLVGNDEKLDDVRKLHYLKSCLTGDASDVLKNLKITKANYNIAWTVLRNKFEKKRIISNSHIKNILQLEKINRESVSELRILSNELNKNLRCLRGLGHPVDSWDNLLIQIIISKVDTNTLKEWEKIEFAAEYPTMAELLQFFQKRCEYLSAIGSVQLTAQVAQGKTVNKFKSDISKLNSYHVSENNELNCNFCDKDHLIYNCSDFIKLDVQSRIEEVKKRKLCLNCLRRNHFIKDCKSTNCRKCKKPHHTFLHLTFDNTVTHNDSENEETEITQNNVSCHTSNISNYNQVILATAMIMIEDVKGKLHNCRALLDCGSQSNFITEDLCTKLGLIKTNTHISISGIANHSSKIKARVNLKVHSMRNNFNRELSCLVLQKITDDLPNHKIDISSIPGNLQLADSNYFMPGVIYILLGAEVFWHVLCSGQIRIEKGELTLHKTLFGWIISGSVPLKKNTFDNDNINKTYSYHSTANQTFEDSINKFWELEEVENQNTVLTKEEQLGEAHYVENVKRHVSGRFVVKIPFKENVNQLGESKHFALKRLYSIERKLSKNTSLKIDYHNFMQEYLNLGHMSLLKNDDSNIGYYLPHHSVEKASSSTTKVRVVFDASCKTTSNLSLNDVQMIGPVIQRDLFTLILNFRCFRYAVTADCEKMYRQIELHEDHKSFHKILWRWDPEEDVQSFTLNTVTYGTASASFLSTRVLKDLADRFQQKYPIASHIITNNFYIDDLLVGVDSTEELHKLIEDVTFILSEGGFPLRKWLSNHPTLLDMAKNDCVSLGKNDERATLGIVWNPQTDLIKYYFYNLDVSTSLTKRIVLSISSKIFDPLGLLSPIIVVCKLIVQKLWQLKLSWDESIPSDLQTIFIKFIDDARAVKYIEVPRRNSFITEHAEIHGFADSSERAYGACLYLVTVDSEGTTRSMLLCSKSKVAPVKTATTLPRLELCACVLLCRLVQKTVRALDIKINKVCYYSDSTIALSWINSEPSRWKTFICNRVSEIHQSSEGKNWFHVKTNENPADIITRGSTPQFLKNSELWWHGPAWLRSKFSVNFVDQNLDCIADSVDYVKELKPVKSLVSVNNSVDLFTRFSSFGRMCRIIAYCLRFINNIRKRLPINDNDGSLSIDEVNNSKTVLLKLAQMDAFQPEIKQLTKKLNLNRQSKIIGLNPFLDINGLIRVGGRLVNSSFGYDKIHPIIIPKNHVISTLIASDEHIRLFHCGAQQLLFSLRERYWPISGRNLVKNVVHKYVVCFKANPKSSQQLMGALPCSRFESTFPFEVTGVDFAGPFIMKNSLLRNSKTSKVYIALFVCFSTKSIHLDLVTDLTSEAFLACLRRFVARRGKPRIVYSDNGTNFVGTKTRLSELSNFLSDGKQKKLIIDYALVEGISWKFIPPRAPHFGGLWEAGVKRVKFHLKRVIGSNSFTFEKFLTVILQIEGILNSRPLFPLSNDPSDLNPITPAHFLIGRTITSMLDKPLLQIKESRLEKYEKLQKLVQSFWERWRHDYIGELQIRNKWKLRETQMAKGDLVLIKEDNMPPCVWKMGRVQELKYGADELPRVAIVLTSNGIIKRPITKLCILPLENDNSD